MKIHFFCKEDKTPGSKQNIYVRIYNGKKYDIRTKTPILIYADCFKNGEVKIPRICSDEKRETAVKAQNEISKLQAFLFEKLQKIETLTAKEAKLIVTNSYYMATDAPSITTVDCLVKFANDQTVSLSTKKHRKILLHYIENKPVRYTTHADIIDICEKIDASQIGHNYKVGLKRMLRTFCNWMQRNEYTKDLWGELKIENEQYGTPFYLTQEERDQLAEADLPERLQTQRDIFIFQCYIGCRVSDLLQLTQDNLQNGSIKYIAQKTQKRQQVITVPLAKKAIELIEKYHDPERKTLFPYISAQKYNDIIKTAAKIAGLDRQIIVIDSAGKKQFKPLYDVISSHCARRTFIGILYKKTKDVNVIASMSGHAENSRAFARYRAIDDDDKKELINLL